MSAMEKAMEAERDETREGTRRVQEVTRRVGEGTRREREETRRKREETRRERDIVLLWEICDRLAQGMYYFLISSLMAYHSGSGLNDIKRSTDEKLKQALIYILSKDNRFRYCAHLENFSLSSHAAYLQMVDSASVFYPMVGIPE